ncbi:cold shock domain-containing protein [Streptomyces sp. ISL-98]|uniref:cold-shock protein n=1 Tax=Streptomyces sp. ISL-98 TaxID=2819192 RepID=UPI001BEA10D1|nr:cold shock domain-containing protein [Streptomyces sp. ISL-98]MBT2511222.1 cold shock domain-containing protein [Streptomyces sp. ISL-98]
MPRGVVKWFSPEKRWGVIARKEEEPDARVDSVAIQGCFRDQGLRAGDRVVFDVIVDSEGVRAENVRRAGGCC